MNPKLCFSYIRFSSEGQRDGTSVARQSEIAQTVARQKGWTIRQDFNAEDLGVSAYKGDNLKTIQTIVDAVNSGKIPQGTVMILEALDRLTRQDIDTAAPLLWNILGSGLEIYIAKTERHLTRDSLKNLGEVIMALLELKAAFEYSDKIADRVKKAIQLRTSKILNGEKVTIGKLPSWVDQKSFALNEKAGAIQNIFKMYLDGIGAGRMATEFNQKGIETVKGKGVWSQSFIYKLLSNRQVLGEYVVNGETVKGYLPAVVTEETFLKVQAKLNDNRGKRPTGTPTGRINNIFSGVAFCKCGNKIKHAHGKRVNYLTCYGVVNGLGCSDSAIPFGKFESAFRQIFKVNPAQLIRDETDNSFQAESQILRGKLAEIQKQKANITESLKVKVVNALVIVLSNLETEEADIQAQLQQVSAKTVSAKGSSDKLSEIVNRLNNLENDNDLRTTVQEWIRANVNKVTVDRSEGTFTVDLKSGTFLKMDLAGHILEAKYSVSVLNGLPLPEPVEMTWNVSTYTK